MTRTSTCTMRSHTLDTPEALLARLVDASSEALFCQAVDGTVLTWNPAAERLYGWTAREAVGRPARALLAGPEPAGLDLAFAQSLVASGPVSACGLHRRADGRLVPVQVTHTPLPDADGRTSAVATSVLDRTDTLRLDAELQRLRQEREERDAALLRSNRDLQQFAYVASHDLSEPLRVMTGYVQQLEHRYDDVLDDRGRRYMHHVVEASARMRALIDDLLEYSQFLRPPGACERVDTGDALRTVLAAQAGAVADAGATVTSDPLPDVWCVRSDVTTVLTNLVSNAVRYRSPDRPCAIHVTGSVELGRVTLAVEDNGIGIEPPYRERVFRMFQRLHGREEYPGTGIGLALIRQVAERHGGRSWVDDSPSGGTRVCVVLPVAPGGSGA